MKPPRADPSARTWCAMAAARISPSRRTRLGGVGWVHLAALLVALLAGCTVLPDKPTGAPSRALTDTGDTTLGKLAATAAARDGDGRGEDADPNADARTGATRPSGDV